LEQLSGPLDRLVERLTWSWGIVGHLMGVKTAPNCEKHTRLSAPRRAVLQQAEPNQPLYKAFKALRASDTWASLESANSGLWKQPLKMPSFPVCLEGEKRDQCYSARVGRTFRKFSNHVLDATKTFSLT